MVPWNLESFPTTSEDVPEHKQCVELLHDIQTWKQI